VFYLNGMTASAEGYSIMMMLEGGWGGSGLGIGGIGPKGWISCTYSCNIRQQ
jgi:hypothetical protein